MGCCTTTDKVSASPGQDVHLMAGPLTKRNKKHVYEVTFPTRPLYIHLTSSEANIDGYITMVHKKCPVEAAQEQIVLNSKVIYVNSLLVEGYKIDLIAKRMKEAILPIKLILVHPDGLGNSEGPVYQPESIILIQDSPT